MAHLTLVVQGREVRKFVLNPSVTTIGRAQDNDIVINNLALSRRHAEVHLRQGRYEVEDLGSQNGVFVNNDRIRGPKSLGNADTITLGTYHFVFSDDARRDPDIKGVRNRRAQEVTHLEDPVPLAEELEVEEPAPLLVLKYNEVELQRVPVKGEELLIGRAKECDIQIAERRLSRRHCKIFRRDGDRWSLTDLGSQNGTYVNRRKIPEVHELKHGDVLNFAEYAVHFLADAAEYDGPDRQNGSVGKIPAPRPSSGIEREETEFPEAYADSQGYSDAGHPSILPHDRPVEPQDLEDPEDFEQRAPMSVMPKDRQRGRKAPEDPADGPMVERPVHSRERRRQARREIREVAPSAPNRKKEAAPAARVAEPTSRPARRAEPVQKSEPAVRVRRVQPSSDLHAAASKPPRPARPARPLDAAPLARDVDDYEDEVRPDESLDDWYSARDDSDIRAEEPSVLLERSKSSMSQLLSTMMVDKRELDKNLGLRAKERKFAVHVTWGDEVVYAGPLRHAVTILGTDKEADIQLKGRYVAGRHSILVRVRDSLLLVRLGSSSAARVNGLPKLQAFLKSGDVVQIDETTIKIVEE